MNVNQWHRLNPNAKSRYLSNILVPVLKFR